MAANRPGRPREMPEGVADKIALSLAKGLPFDDTAMKYGVKPGTLRNWFIYGLEALEDNKEEGKFFKQFLMKLSSLKLARIEKCIDNIFDNEKGHKGAEVILDKVYAEHYGKSALETEVRQMLDFIKQKKESEDGI